MASQSPARNDISASMRPVIALLAVSVFINYIDRGNLSIAAPLLKDELHLSASQLGWLLSAFFWTYTFLQPVAGWLTDRVDENVVLAGGFLLWSVATALTGFAYGFVALLAVRMLLGVGESVAFPCYSKIIARRIPEEKRGTTNSMIIAGLHLGPAVGTLFGGVLMAQFGWRPFFIAVGLLSLIWLLPWWKSSTRLPEISERNQRPVPSVWEILAQRSAWGTYMGQFAGNYVTYFMVTWMPFYLVREQHMTMVQMAKVGAIAYIVGAATAALGGWLSDRWIRGGASTTVVRKAVTVAGLTFGATFLIACSYAGVKYVPVLLALAMAGSALSGSNLYAIAQTLAGPRAAGRWVGLQNSISNLAGIVAPALTGIVVERTGHFRAALVIAAVVSLMGAAAWWFVVGPVKQVEWKCDSTPTAADPADQTA